MPTNPLYPVISDLLPLEKIPSELQVSANVPDFKSGNEPGGTIAQTLLNERI